MRSNIELGLGFSIGTIAFSLFASGCAPEKISAQPVAAYGSPGPSLRQSEQVLYDVTQVAKEAPSKFNDIYVRLKKHYYREITEGKPQLVEIEEFDKGVMFVTLYRSSSLSGLKEPVILPISDLPTRKFFLTIGEAYPKKNKKNPKNIDFIDKNGKSSKGRLLYKLANEDYTPLIYQGTFLYLEKDSTTRKVRLIDNP